MGFFHRSASFSSSRSRSHSQSSSHSTASDTSTTPRTSSESNRMDDTIVLKRPQQSPQQIQQIHAPLLTLPVELLQQVASYLDTPCCASLSLSSRYLCYALGTNHLTRHLEGAKSSFDKRGIIEGLVERAFPGHWYCAWCTVFHSWDESTGPASAGRAGEGMRDCDRFNGYISASPPLSLLSSSSSPSSLSSDKIGEAGSQTNYTILYHHIRLALSAHLHGPSHGIPLSAFTHHSTPRIQLWKTTLPSTLNISARISPSTQNFLLQTSFSLTLPSWSLTHPSLVTTLFPLLPSILTAHRASPNGHTGLMAALDNVLRREWMYPSTQTCAGCTTDWAVSSHVLPGKSNGVRVTIRSWRDLGRGESGFEKMWRRHGVWREGREAGFREGVSDRRKGDVRRAFEMGQGVGGRGRAINTDYAAVTGAGMQTTTTTTTTRGRQRDEFEHLRGRSRPWSWRSRSQNEEAARRETEYRVAMARRVAEGLVRLDAVADERGRMRSLGR